MKKLLLLCVLASACGGQQIDAPDRPANTDLVVSNGEQLNGEQLNGEQLNGEQLNGAGMGVNVCFVMQAKNHFNYFVFLDENGTAELSKSEYLPFFDQERSAFMMDYADPRIAFAGMIEAKLLDKADLEAAVRACDSFHDMFKYPEAHRERLQKGLALLLERKAPVGTAALTVERHD